MAYRLGNFIYRVNVLVLLGQKYLLVNGIEVAVGAQLQPERRLEPKFIAFLLEGAVDLYAEEHAAGEFVDEFKLEGLKTSLPQTKQPLR